MLKPLNVIVDRSGDVVTVMLSFDAYEPIGGIAPCDMSDDELIEEIVSLTCDEGVDK